MRPCFLSHRHSLAIVPLATLLAATPAWAANWVRVETPNFIVLGEPSEKRVREVAEQFERFREALGRVLPGAATRAAVPTVVVVFSSKGSFEPYRPRFNGRPTDVGGYFVATNDLNLVALTIENRDHAMRIVFHEYAHLVVANIVREIPAWLSEGLAEYYSTFSVQDEGRTAVLGAPIHEHLVRLNTERLIPQAELLKVDHSSPLYNEGERRSVFYAQSWALVHMLVSDKPDRSRELAEYMGLTASGTPAADAWAAAFGSGDINSDLKRYVARLTLRAFRYSFDEEIPAVRGAVTTPTEGDVEAALADLLYHTGQTQAAEARLQRAAGLENPSPRALALLGLLRLEQNRSDEAQGLLTRSLDAGPDWLVQYQAATGLTRLLEGTPDTAASALAARARNALAVVTGARPDLANALALGARISTETGTQLDEALRDIRKARTLAPGREDYAFGEAHVLVERRQFSEARMVLGPLLSARYHTSVRDRARQMMSQVVRIESAAREMAERRQAAGGGDSPAPKRESAADTSHLLPVFRKVLAGEERSEGLLERVDCSREGIVLQVRVGSDLLRFVAPRFEAVDFISYRADLAAEIRCLPRTPPDPVYVTWRPPVAPAKDPLAIAVEFLPVRSPD